MAEEICDDSIWVYKSHDPVPVMGCMRAIADKVLVCVRNPYDTIASHFVFSATTNQGGQIENKFSQWPEDWEKFVKARINLIKIYHDVVLNVHA
jgi:hypothetical protein